MSIVCLHQLRVGQIKIHSLDLRTLRLIVLKCLIVIQSNSKCRLDEHQIGDDCLLRLQEGREELVTGWHAKNQ